MRWSLVLLLAVGCGSAVAQPERDPMEAVWADVFGRGDAAPFIEWREGNCNGPQAGFAVWNAEARTTYCLGGQAMSEEYVWVARWDGSSLADRELARRVAHEFAHSYLMRLGVYDGDFRHEGPEWQAGELVERATDHLVATARP